MARRDHSVKELTQKLIAKGYLREEIKQVTDDLVAAHLLSDARFTEQYIYWRSRKGFGPLRISMELEARGVPALLIADQLKITDNAWFAEIRRIWQKHFKGRLPSDFKDKAKQMRFLQYRGFTREQIESVFEVVENQE